ncbi:MAG: polysaccharide biosynthesis C-terminal domain-containing protein, partial [Muribaculaceae bacterium]|nr:polysaccharide biosynthesis C-terminal domain-containing protein [Muribaculaceae bacterium]
MLSGPLGKRMLMFALPLIASGVLQQSFNSVDVAVVGRFAGSHALAAVGSNGPVISLLINMFLGLSVGVNVVIANYIGQRNREGIRQAVATSAFLALASGISMLVLSQVIARPLLTALDTPAEVLDDAVLYLRLIGLGMPFMMIYNFGAAILRSIGDTGRPFFSLVIAGVVNVVLNLVFVVGMGMGVAGVALGTIVSNIVNEVIINVILMRAKIYLSIDQRSLRPSAIQIRKICGVGIPASVQAS